MSKRRLYGKVVSSKSDKTVVVEIIRTAKHNFIKKSLKK